MNERIWTCAVCGRQDIWGRGWQWFGRLETEPRQGPAVERVVCSTSCREVTTSAVITAVDAAREAR